MKHLCIFLALCGHGGRFNKTALLVELSAEFDAATTYTALNARPGTYEVNPLLRPFARNASIFPVLLATSVSVNWLARREARHHHPRLARALQLITIADHTACGIHNLNVLEGK